MGIMDNRTEHVNHNGFLMLNGPQDTLWIPRTSNKSWLTLFYALPRELVQKQPEYLSLPRCPYDVLRTDRYDDLINDDLFLQLVWDCYAWMIFQRIPVPKKDGTYRDIPGLDLHYSGDFPLWRLSYYMVGVMRDMFEQFGTSFQALFRVQKDQDIPFMELDHWAVFIGDMTAAIIVKKNWQPMIDDIWNNRTPEDYSEFYSRVKAAFEAQWSHKRTSIGRQMRSLEALMENSDEKAAVLAVADENDYAEEAVNRITGEQFLATLSERDQTILHMKKEGYTNQEIAEKVGYKTHSAVVKRMKRIAASFEDFTKEGYREYLDTFDQ